MEELGGTLALRGHWCRPDEPILVSAPCYGTMVKFDVQGPDWRGKAQTGGRKVMEAVGRVEGVGGEKLDPPSVVVFGPSAGQACQAVLPGFQQDTWGRCSWVLTPYRIGVVRFAGGQDAEVPEAAAGRGVLGRARKIAAGAVELGRSLSREYPYPPGEPVPLARVAGAAEIPAAATAGIGLAERKLPSGYRPRKVPVLRVGLHDGSGFDIVASDDQAAQRLLHLAARRH